MQKIHQKIRLFLSSPNDVEAERDEVLKIAAQINRRLGDGLGFYLEVIEWKTHGKVGWDTPNRPALLH